MDLSLAEKVAGEIGKELAYSLGTAYLEQKVREFLEKGKLPLGLITYYASRLIKPLDLEYLNTLIGDVLKSHGEFGKASVSDANIIRRNGAEFEYALYCYTVFEELMGEASISGMDAEDFEISMEEVSEAFRIQSDALNSVSSFTLAIATRNEKAQLKLKVVVPEIYDGLMEKLANCPVFVKIVAISNRDKLRKIVKELTKFDVDVKLMEDKLIVNLKPSHIGRPEIYDAIVKPRRLLGLF
jgi:hypothetical protein